MARRRSTGGVWVFGLLLLIAIPLVLLQKAADAFGAVSLVLGLMAVIGLLIAYRIHKTAARLAYLTKKYGNEVIAQQIMRRTYWLGQTSEQLRDSLGEPVMTDHILLKTRKREVWKYNQRGKNRFGLRITLDDDSVANWEHKNQ
jgi:hypothetical protein